MGNMMHKKTYYEKELISIQLDVEYLGIIYRFSHGRDTMEYKSSRRKIINHFDKLKNILIKKLDFFQTCYESCYNPRFIKDMYLCLVDSKKLSKCNQIYSYDLCKQSCALYININDKHIYVQFMSTKDFVVFMGNIYEQYMSYNNICSNIKVTKLKELPNNITIDIYKFKNHI